MELSPKCRWRFRSITTLTRPTQFQSQSITTRILRIPCQCQCQCLYLILCQCHALSRIQFQFNSRIQFQFNSRIQFQFNVDGVDVEDTVDMVASGNHTECYCHVPIISFPSCRMATEEGCAMQVCRLVTLPDHVNKNRGCGEEVPLVVRESSKCLILLCVSCTMFQFAKARAICFRLLRWLCCAVAWLRQFVLFFSRKD